LHAPSQLVIEIDDNVHAEPEQAQHDAQRTAWLTERGYRILRFANEDVFKRMDGVLEAIREAARAGPPPNPLP
jgi:very-short-patch-repair endonuclease